MTSLYARGCINCLEAMRYLIREQLEAARPCSAYSWQSPIATPDLI
jgi:hypothetical protein